MPQQIPTAPERSQTPEPIGSKKLTAGQTPETKPAGLAIVWVFAALSVVAIIGMIVVLVLNNR